MSSPAPGPFFLIVYDADRRIFSIEGPMFDDLVWDRMLARRRRNREPLHCATSYERTKSMARQEWQASFPGWTEVDVTHVMGAETSAPNGLSKQGA